MLHPSYTDLMSVVNAEVEPGEQPVVNSRYSTFLQQQREQERSLMVRSLWWQQTQRRSHYPSL